MSFVVIGLVVGIVAGWEGHRFYLGFLYKQLRLIKRQLRGGRRLVAQRRTIHAHKHTERIVAWWPDWVFEGPAACRDPDIDPDIFFDAHNNKRAQAKAKAICGRCTVRIQCLRENLEVPEGIFGGFTPLERWRLMGRTGRPEKSYGYQFFERVYITASGNILMRPARRANTRKRVKRRNGG